MTIEEYSDEFTISIQKTRPSRHPRTHPFVELDEKPRFIDDLRENTKQMAISA